jgi:putative ABC transport system permease protein
MSVRPTERATQNHTQGSPVPLIPLKRQDFDRTGKLGVNVSMAVVALWANRLRSLLTALGIVIGVAAVIAALTMTQGVSTSISNAVSSLGTNMIIIAPGTSNKSSGSGGMWANRASNAVTASGATLSLTPADAQAITRIPDVAAVSPVISMNQQVIAGNQNWGTTVQGVNASFQSIRNWSTERGDWFTASDDQGARLVAVLGQTVYQQLFANIGQDPLGKTIRIGNASYRVIGVLQAKGGANIDDAVFVPFKTASYRLKSTVYVDQILVQVDDTSMIDRAQRDITSLLEQRHHILKGMADDFNLTTSQQLLETFNQNLSLFTTLFIGIASISLTVGGVGIMNIMIVSVTERTREIGVRLSLGAERQDIRNQFLIEALILSLAGGAIGLLLGMLCGYGATRMILGVPLVITPISLLVPFVVSASIGVIFGFYPAARAARLDPVEALRSL